MPGEFDLSEYGHLRNVPEMIRQMGVPYTAPAQAGQPAAAAAPATAGLSLPMLLQYLSAVAPWTLLGGAGLAQGGSVDPNAARFYQERPMQMQRMGERQPMPGVGADLLSNMRGRMGLTAPLRAPQRRFWSPAPQQPFNF